MSIHRTGFATAFSLTLSATACDVSEPEPNATEELRSSDLEDAGCPVERQIARLDEGVPACPTVTGWKETPLFPNATGELQEFCKYEWEVGTPTQNDIAALQGASGLAEVASDCEVVFEQGDAMFDAVGYEIESLFHYGIGRATATDLALPATETSRSPVVVAVVDSVPEPAPLQPRSEHGERMVSLIEDIACPDPNGSCAVDVLRSLGLPRYGSGQIDTTNGGEYGSQADIAEAIYQAVKEWEANHANAKLVINMSIAWEGEIFGDTDDATPRPSVDAVHTALEFAACHGATLIAAAGNQGHLCTIGPLLPGGWEQHPAPDQARCNDLDAPSPPGGIGYKPLVYSVGGLTHELGPMPGSRVDGRPRLAALADHAIAGGDSTALTGTSVSSAVGAGAAALVLSYVPGLTPSELMTVIYQSGDLLSQTADYIGPSTSYTNIRGIDVCRAIHLACELPNVNCPAMPLGCFNAAPPLTVDDLFDAIEALTPDHEVIRNWSPEIQCPAECSGAASGYLTQALVGIVQSPCPAPIEQTLPFTLPQPTQIGCSNCTLDVPTAIVDASLDVAYAGATVLDVNVGVFDGARTTYFRFGPMPLSATEHTQIRLDPTLMPATVESATISITFASEPRPIVDPLLIGK